MNTDNIVSWTLTTEYHEHWQQSINIDSEHNEHSDSDMLFYVESVGHVAPANKICAH